MPTRDFAEVIGRMRDAVPATRSTAPLRIALERVLDSARRSRPEELGLLWSCVRFDLYMHLGPTLRGGDLVRGTWQHRVDAIFYASEAPESWMA